MNPITEFQLNYILEHDRVKLLKWLDEVFFDSQTRAKLDCRLKESLANYDVNNSDEYISKLYIEDTIEDLINCVVGDE